MLRQFSLYCVDTAFWCFGFCSPLHLNYLRGIRHFHWIWNLITIDIREICFSFKVQVPVLQTMEISHCFRTWLPAFLGICSCFFLISNYFPFFCFPSLLSGLQGRCVYILSILKWLWEFFRFSSLSSNMSCSYIHRYCICQKFKIWFRRQSKM